MGNITQHFKCNFNNFWRKYYIIKMIEKINNKNISLLLIISIDLLLKCSETKFRTMYYRFYYIIILCKLYYLFIYYYIYLFIFQINILELSSPAFYPTRNCIKNNIFRSFFLTFWKTLLLGIEIVAMGWVKRTLEGTSEVLRCRNKGKQFIQ